jgi:hypothetical protein
MTRKLELWLRRRRDIKKRWKLWKLRNKQKSRGLLSLMHKDLIRMDIHLKVEKTVKTVKNKMKIKTK